MCAAIMTSEASLKLPCDYCTYQTLSLSILNPRATHFMLKCGNACHHYFFVIPACTLSGDLVLVHCAINSAKLLFHPHMRKIS